MLLSCIQLNNEQPDKVIDKARQKRKTKLRFILFPAFFL